MFHETSLDDFAASDPREVFPVVRECPSDMVTPVGAAIRLFTPGEPCFLLESAEGGETVGRFSMLGLRPVSSIGKYGESLDDLRTFLAAHRVAKVELPAAMPAGAVGYLSYDAVRLWESVDDRHEEKSEPAFLFHHFRDLVVFDHLKQRLYFVTLTPSGAPRTTDEYRRAHARLDKLEEAIETPIPVRKHSNAAGADPIVRAVPNDDAFRAMVSKAKEHIDAGEISQVVLSRSFESNFDGDPLDLYRALRMINPSPFMFYLHMGDHVAVGASPEDLVRVTGNRVETLPIAGTRRRGKNDAEDEALAADLLSDPKEVSEHEMLVDLAMGDIGKVCNAESVRVEKRMMVEKFSHVIHLVSRVAGEKRPDADAIDALAACFPAGTVSGAPKVTAMNLIDAMESSARGFYAGSVVYFDGRGNLDSCIAIRSLILRDGKVTVRAGAGIVAASEPAAEETETRNKAAGTLAALKLAQQLG